MVKIYVVIAHKQYEVDGEIKILESYEEEEMAKKRCELYDKKHENDDWYAEYYESELIMND
ncbi:MAG: hypothetical protein ACFFG0_08120 [Candidatus Thorarchaeota archaeon]